MARSRNIKPGFFSNEDLVELDFATRLLFAGLWTVADREGRLEDRPKKIKIAVFPADDLDINAMLQALHDRKFIVRYEVNGARYVQITAWSKHQNPHHTEKASEIPGVDGAITVKAPLEPRQPRIEDGGYLADSLIPDSLSIDSLIPDALVVLAAVADKPSRANRKTKLPENFEPDDTGAAKCAASGISLPAQLEKFKDFHAGKGSLMLDWQAAFRTWIGNAKQFGPHARASPEPAWRTESRERTQQAAPGVAARPYDPAPKFFLDVETRNVTENEPRSIARHLG